MNGVSCAGRSHHLFYLPEAKSKNRRKKAVQRMPELPEIETIKHMIEPQITGLAIEKATVLRPEVIAHPAADEFCKAVTGQTVLAMERRGKCICA